MHQQSENNKFKEERQKLVQIIRDMTAKPERVTHGNIGLLASVFEKQPHIVANIDVLCAFSDFIEECARFKNVEQDITNIIAKAMDNYNNVLMGKTVYGENVVVSKTVYIHNSLEFYRQGKPANFIDAPKSTISLWAGLDIGDTDKYSKLVNVAKNKSYHDDVRLHAVDKLSNYDFDEKLELFSELFESEDENWRFRTNVWSKLAMSDVLDDSNTELTEEQQFTLFDALANGVKSDNKKVSDYSRKMIIQYAVEQNVLESVAAQRVVIDAVIQKARTVKENDAIHACLQKLSTTYPESARNCVDRYVGKLVFSRNAANIQVDKAVPLVNKAIQGEWPFIGRRKARRIINDFRGGMIMLTSQKNNIIKQELNGILSIKHKKDDKKNPSKAEQVIEGINRVRQNKNAPRN